jgi:hypothetical protein
MSVILGPFTQNTNLASCDQKFCVVQPNLCRPTQIESFQFVYSTKFCVFWPNFMSSDQILCCPTKFCVVRPNFVSSDQIFWRSTKFCVVRTNFLSSDKILCLLTVFFVAQRQICVSCKQTLHEGPKRRRLFLSGSFKRSMPLFSENPFFFFSRAC